MPSLSNAHAAAVRACVALLDAFYSDQPTAKCRELLRAAIEHAMDATGMPEDCRPNVDDVLAEYGLHAASKPALGNV